MEQEFDGIGESGSEAQAGAKSWEDLEPEYVRMIHDDDSFDSAYLRASGLKPTIIDLIGRRPGHILDLGCGDGWLFDAIEPDSGVECDLADNRPGTRSYPFQQEDVRALSFDDNTFDTVVASLLLIWIDDLPSAASELLRVTKPNGRLIIALMHPHFYRTGNVDEDGSFRVTSNLGRPRAMDVNIANHAGPVTYYYRSLTEYLTVLLDAGWELSRVQEWHIDMEDYEESAGGKNKNLRRTGNVPMYAFLEMTNGVT